MLVAGATGSGGPEEHDWPFVSSGLLSLTDRIHAESVNRVVILGVFKSIGVVDWCGVISTIVFKQKRRVG